MRRSAQPRSVQTQWSADIKWVLLKLQEQKVSFCFLAQLRDAVGKQARWAWLNISGSLSCSHYGNSKARYKIRNIEHEKWTGMCQASALHKGNSKTWNNHRWSARKQEEIVSFQIRAVSVVWIYLGSRKAPCWLCRGTLSTTPCSFSHREAAPLCLPAIEVICRSYQGIK